MKMHRCANCGRRRPLGKMWMSLRNGWLCDLDGEGYCGDITLGPRIRRWLSRRPTSSTAYRARAREAIAAPKWRGVYR